ncbi:MAG: asparagine synthetase B family protein [Betaproteobacteria bacterium]
MRKALNAIRYRGPDDLHVVEHDRYVLGHVRLSIIGLGSEGLQPAVDDAGAALVFNGEIYNYKELATRHGVAGGSNATSDTQVLFALLRAYGERIVPELDGMFAFVYRDSVGRILLVRDRFGIKPLFYAVQNGVLMVASELRSLPGVTLQPDYDVVRNYISTGFYPTGANKTFFADVMQVEAGTVLSWVPNTTVAVSVSYLKGIDLGDPPRTVADLETVLEGIRGKISESDVPICFSLSGGVDSTLGLATFAQWRNRGREGIHAITSVPFSDELSELEAATATAAKLGVRLHICAPPSVASETEAIAQLQRLTNILEAPVRSAGVFMQEAVYRHARDLGFKVIIDGEGADDLMGAYYGNLASTLAQISREDGLVTVFREARTIAARCGLRWTRLLVRAAMVSVYKQTTMGGAANGLSTRVAEINDLIARSSLPTLVHWGDRLSMRYSIEARPFYLFQEFRDWSNGLPASEALKDGYNKWPLRKALARKDFDAIAFNTRKFGYSTTSDIFSGLAMRARENKSWEAFLDETFPGPLANNAARTSFRAFGAYIFLQVYGGM